MVERPIYLDYSATTPVLPEVVDAMLPYGGVGTVKLSARAEPKSVVS